MDDDVVDINFTNVGVALLLIADGEVIHPATTAGESIFHLPAKAQDIRLASDAFAPDEMGIPDSRRLGVSLQALVFVSADESRPVPLSDPRLQNGFHPEEAQAGAHWRWTRGELRLGPEFHAGMTGEIALHVRHDDSATRAWVPPAPQPPLRLISLFG